MATTAQENFRVTLDEYTAQPDPAVTTAAPINQGDMVKAIVNAGVSTTFNVVTAKTDGRNLGGIAEESFPAASNLDNTTVGVLPRVQLKPKGVFRLKATNGQTYDHGTPLWIGADAQTITNVAGTGEDCIGWAWIPFGASVVAGATTQIDIALRANFPGATIPAAFDAGFNTAGGPF